MKQIFRNLESHSLKTIGKVKRLGTNVFLTLGKTLNLSGLLQ